MFWQCVVKTFHLSSNCYTGKPLTFVFPVHLYLDCSQRACDTPNITTTTPSSDATFLMNIHRHYFLETHTITKTFSDFSENKPLRFTNGFKTYQISIEGIDLLNSNFLRKVFTIQ